MAYFKLKKRSSKVSNNAVNTFHSTNNSRQVIRRSEEEDTELLLQKIRHFFISCNMSDRMFSKFPIATSVNRLEKVVKLICEMIFSPSAVRTDRDIMFYTTFCKVYEIDETPKRGDVKEGKTFKEVLISTIIIKLQERLCYKRRLQDVVQLYKGPEDKKEKWMNYHSNKLKRYYSRTEYTSRKFLLSLYSSGILTNETIYEVLQTLQPPSEESINYLYPLLKEIGAKNSSGQQLFSSCSWFYGKNLPLLYKEKPTLEKLAYSILQDFLDGFISVEEARQKIKEDYYTEYKAGIFIEAFLMTSLKERFEEQKRVGEFLSSLMGNKVFSQEILVDKLTSVYKEVKKIARTNHDIFLLQAQLIVPLLTSKKVNLVDLGDAWLGSGMLFTNSIFNLLTPIFKLLVEEEGGGFARQIWDSSNLSSRCFLNSRLVKSFKEETGM